MIFDEVLALYPEISVTVHEEEIEVRDWQGIVYRRWIGGQLEFEYL
jgi:hypothetical protein